ncbi:MAG: zf-HC2 domain-containing protein [Deltaproteobacteria bacterium]
MNDEHLDALLAQGPEPRPQGAHVDDGVLVAFRDGRLGDDETAHVEAHLAGCRECRELLEELAVDVEPEMFDRARAAARRNRRSGRALVVGLALAAATLAAFFLPRNGPLPPYAVEGPMGGLTTVRGTSTGGEVFVPDSRVKILLRPERPTRPPRLTVFVVDLDGTAVRAPEGVVTAGEQGGFRVEFTASDLFNGTFGVRTVRLVLSDGAAETQFEVAVDYREERGSQR